jgi:hypothetical protein
MILLQSPLAYGGGDATATATAGLPSSPLPPPLFVPSSDPSPHDTFFIGDDFPAAFASESRSHATLFGGGGGDDMGWDNLITCQASAFSNNGK